MDILLLQDSILHYDSILETTLLEHILSISRVEKEVRGMTLLPKSHKKLYPAVDGNLVFLPGQPDSIMVHSHRHGILSIDTKGIERSIMSTLKNDVSGFIPQSPAE
jgi:hypothetical protein